MQNYDDSNKEFRTVFGQFPLTSNGVALQKTRNINELLNSVQNRTGLLRARIEARHRVLGQVRALLPASLAEQVVSAGLERGELSVGVRGAGWASRLRYAVQALRTGVSASLGEPVVRVRIRVLPAEPSAPPADPAAPV